MPLSLRPGEESLSDILKLWTRDKPVELLHGSRWMVLYIQTGTWHDSTWGSLHACRHLQVVPIEQSTCAVQHDTSLKSCTSDLLQSQSASHEGEQGGLYPIHSLEFPWLIEKKYITFEKIKNGAHAHLSWCKHEGEFQRIQKFTWTCATAKGYIRTFRFSQTPLRGLECLHQVL